MTPLRDVKNKISVIQTGGTYSSVPPSFSSSHKSCVCGHGPVACCLLWRGYQNYSTQDTSSQTPVPANREQQQGLSFVDKYGGMAGSYYGYWTFTGLLIPNSYGGFWSSGPRRPGRKKSKNLQYSLPVDVDIIPEQIKERRRNNL